MADRNSLRIFIGRITCHFTDVPSHLATRTFFVTIRSTLAVEATYPTAHERHATAVTRIPTEVSLETVSTIAAHMTHQDHSLEWLEDLPMTNIHWKCHHHLR